MQETSDLYKQIIADPNHETEVMLDIAGVEYTKSDIVSAKVSGGVYSTPGIGNCASRQAEFSVVPKSDIPRQAKIKPYVRVSVDELYSEWLQKGEFFISTRKKDAVSGVLSISAFDAMLKAEQVWLTSDYDLDDWPKTQRAAVEDIAARMGVTVDPRTVLNEAYPVDYPIDENGDLTMREVLGYIAVSNAGNWIISDTGALRLIPYGQIPEDTSFLSTPQGYAILFGEVRLLV